MPLTPTDTLTILQPTVTLADPHVLSDIRDRRSVADALFDALVRRDAHGGFGPWLAERWEVSADCRCWTFWLRAGVTCHDAGPLTAFDAAASLLRAIAPDLPGELGTQGVARSYLLGAQIVAQDERTLQIAAAAPFADLLDLLVDMPIVPQRAHANLPHAPVGSGPYQLAHATTGELELLAFTSHWAGAPPVNRLLWRTEPDPAQRVAQLLTGAADIAVDLPVAADAAVQAVSGQVVTAPSHLCVIFMANCFHGPCADVRVRQALNYALDVDALIADPAIMAGAARRLAGPVTARHSGADPDTPPYRFDPNHARALLAAAGYPDGLTLTVDLPARFPDESIALTERMAALYAQIGVRCDLRVHHDRPGYADMVRAKQIGDLCCFDSSPASTYRVLREKLDARQRGPWWQGYQSDALNVLLDRAAATPSAAERAALFRQIFQIAHTDAPWVYLYAPDHRWGLGPRAAGWQPSAEGRVRLTAPID